ncbi:hypothetical protein HanXRQr2_Chr02g0056681 [Helianthus annuus]|uniref:Uncharacterized protein n=1 Tax=Helianthus annuus TaxID=4232 RepID=A0A9K3JMI6_HELAN|nr:hypothetical protein HanXRQr2_Chr02g0056681 [Helianthus annuus]
MTKLFCSLNKKQIIYSVPNHNKLPLTILNKSFLNKTNLTSKDRTKLTCVSVTGLSKKLQQNMHLQPYACGPERKFYILIPVIIRTTKKKKKSTSIKE